MVFCVSGELMAQISAAHLAEQLGLTGLVVTKPPPSPHHTMTHTLPAFDKT